MASVEMQVREGVARIVLNRPDAMNTIDLPLAEGLLEAAQSCTSDPEVRAVLIRGEGRVFCAGGDLRGFTQAQEGLAGVLKRITTPLHAAVSLLARLDAPVVAAVHGSAAGGGLGLMLACDLVVAAESTRFTMAYTAIGLSPDGSSSYFLPRLVGLRQALDLTLTNRVLSAAEALELGLITRLAPDDEYLQQAEALAGQLATGATRAYGAAKRLLQHSLDTSLETQMELEARQISALGASADAREGIDAFLSKRAPGFRGS